MRPHAFALIAGAGIWLSACDTAEGGPVDQECRDIAEIARQEDPEGDWRHTGHIDVDGMFTIDVPEKCL